MLTIGLTGGVGSGKTTVTQYFSALGVPVIDADELARQLVEPGQPAFNEIVATFGRPILAENGQIDRKKLRQLIFSDPAKRVQLESILHPRIRQAIKEQLKQVDAPYCIVAIPLLIETGQADLVDRILVVDTPRENQIAWTKARDGVSEAEVEAILAAQVSNEVRLAMADDVLENDGSIDDLAAKVTQLHQQYLRLAGVEPDEAATPVAQEPQAEPKRESVMPASSGSVQLVDNATENIYELPLNEKMRTFIRLEFLFGEIEHFLQGDSVWDIRCAVNSFIATLSVLCRPELKTDLMKELDRINVSLAQYDACSEVNTGALSGIREQLADKARQLRVLEGQLGQELKQNDLVTSLRQRESIPGGALAMDMPSYAHWLSQDFEVCANDLRHWLADFMLVKDAVELILKLIRGSAFATEVVAKSGFYQHTLDSELANQIVRVILPKGVNYFPEISGGRHRFTVRFLKPNGVDRPVQEDSDVKFKLICCVL